MLAGGITIAYLLVFYFIDRQLMLNPWVIWSTLAIFIAFMIQACRREGEEYGKQYPFRTALRTAFQVYVVAALLYGAFYYIMFNFVDPGLADLQREMVLERLQGSTGALGENNTETLLERFKEEDFGVTLGDSLLSLGWSLIGGFIVSLGVAGAMRRR